MVQVTIKGRTFNITYQDIIETLEKLNPEPLKGRAKYYIEYKGKKYPIKQVVAAVTGLPRIAFTAKYAYDILTKLGFDVKELKPEPTVEELKKEIKQKMKRRIEERVKELKGE